MRLPCDNIIALNMLSRAEPASSHPTYTRHAAHQNKRGSFFSPAVETKQPFFSPAFVQPKLKLGRPDDQYEQEADTVADQVVQRLSNLQMPMAVQSKCQECEEKEKLQRKEAEDEPEVMKQAEELEETSIQAKAGPGSASTPASNLQSRLFANKGMGSPIESNARAPLESAFGQDFGRVRIHTNNEAAQMNQALNAKAFTHGSDIYFNEGQYSPGSTEGKRLLAHELTHTIQQKQGSKLVQRYTEYDNDAQSNKGSNGWIHRDRPPLKVADSGKLAVGDGKDAWATPANIIRAENTLKSIGSEAKIVKGTHTISGWKPKSRSKSPSEKITLYEVLLRNRRISGLPSKLSISKLILAIKRPLLLKANCGAAARQIMGISNPRERFSAMIKNNGEDLYTDGINYTEGTPGTDFLSRRIYQQCKKAYGGRGWLSQAKMERLCGINRYAAPEIGQAMASDKARPNYIFHFAGVILKDGSDYVTAENTPGNPITDWKFAMYSSNPESTQTFYDKWARDNSTVMVVESEKARNVRTIWPSKLRMYIPLLVLLPLAMGTRLFVIKKKRITKVHVLSFVEVKSGPPTHIGKKGWIHQNLYRPIL